MKHAFFGLIIVLSVTAAGRADESHQPYAGFETREVSSLSADDIAELQRGAGWGLALPAELNGYPGPAHVLELHDELSLTPEQAATIQNIYDAMQQEAVIIGNRLIKSERALDQAFQSKDITAAHLRELIDHAETARADLRFVHLSRHLQMVDLLRTSQIERYAVLRGYGEDACANVPDGHDPEMWRNHNDC